MYLTHLLLALATCFYTAAGVFVDEAYTVDWLIERIGSVNAVVTSSDLTVLAGEVFITALNPATGKVSWRVPVQPGQPATIVKSTSVSGVDSFIVCDGANVMSFSAEGALLWQLRLPEQVTARAVTTMFENNRNDLLVARSDDQVSKVEPLFGTIAWSKRVAGVSHAVNGLSSGFIVQEPESGLLKTVVFSDSETPKEHVLAKKNAKYLDTFGSNQVVWRTSDGSVMVDSEHTGLTTDNYLVIDHTSESLLQRLDGKVSSWQSPSKKTQDLFVLDDDVTSTTRVFPVDVNNDGSSSSSSSSNNNNRLSLIIRGSGDAYQTIELSTSSSGSNSKSSRDVKWIRRDIKVDNVLFLDREDLEVEAELLFEENAGVLSGFVDRVRRHATTFPNALASLVKNVVTFKSFTSNTDHLADFFYKVIVLVNEQQKSFYALDNNAQLLWKVEHLADNGPFTVGSNNKIIGKSHSIDFQGSVEADIFRTSDSNTPLGNGYSVDYNDDHVFGVSQSVETWSYSLDGYQVVAIARRDPDDTTVSIGNVLPDRRVRYKYLHAGTVAAALLNPETNQLRLVLLDVVTGKVLHSKEHSGVTGSEAGGIHLAFGEYWIVYSYVSGNGGGSQLAMWTLYESDLPNDKTLSANQNYSSFDNFPLPVVEAKTVFIPSVVSGLSVSKTRFGITTRDIIVSFANGVILALPPAVINQPDISVLAIDANAVISHERQVFVKQIKTTGCLFESTSLVVGYKPDIFFTRITPSQPFDMLTASFSKTSLVNTVVILLVVIGLLRGPVRQRALDMKWY